jgi:hypothetical protein
MLPRRTSAALLSLTCGLTASAAGAQEKKEAIDGVAGSSRPPALGMSPEAPPTPPAPGGRAPSFAAPTDPDSWVFRLGGRFSAWGTVGFGSSPRDPSASDEGVALHTPPRVLGTSAVYGGQAAKLDFQYGNQLLMATVSYEAQLKGPEWEGHNEAKNGARVRTAFLTVTPPAIGRSRLRFQVGAFPAHYGAPGPWGWGTLGPVFAVHGYGGIAALDHELTGNTLLSFEYGVSAVSEVPEEFVRGTYTEWPEVGVSSVVNHAHAGISFKNKYFAKLHLAHADGRNMRRWYDDDESTLDVIEPRGDDGRIQVAALELRWVGDPYGQLGVTPVFYNFDNARAVHDGFWWGIDWTAGGREMSSKHLGPETRSDGTGQIMAASAEYNFSVSRILRYPDPFDGNGRDLRVALAFMPFWTLSTDDPSYKGANGYILGATVEHVLLSWLSTTYRLFGQSRDSTIERTHGPERGRWTVYNASMGLALHSDWQSRDRMELVYSRYFYSDFTDNNPAQPLDREAITLGASIVF